MIRFAIWILALGAFAIGSSSAQAQPLNARQVRAIVELEQRGSKVTIYDQDGGGARITIDMPSTATDTDLRLAGLLPQTYSIDASNSDISNWGLEALRSIPKLDYLDLINTRISDAGIH